MNDNSIWSASGAPISASMAREQLWLATGGQTGVIGPWSLEVTPQDAPTNSVRINPGSFAIAATLDRYAVGYTSAPWQSYGRSIHEPINVPISPTGSSTGRTDVVGIVIRDPEWDGLELSEAELADHSFWEPYVAENVGDAATQVQHFSGLGRPFLPLAQVKVPRNTTAIDETMIRDLRVTAVSRSHTVPLVQNASTDGNSIVIGPDQTAWMDLPNFTNIQVPQWASFATIMLSLTSAHGAGGQAMGQYRIALTGTNGTWMGSGTSFLEDSGLWTRFDLHGAGTYPLHTSSRGGTVRVRPQIRRSGGSGDIYIPDINITRAQLFGSITFEESARYDRDGA